MSDADLHLGLVGAASYDLAERALRIAWDASEGCVLAGGWAVFAHVPRVPSVDVDLFVPRGDGERLRAAFREVGIRAGPEADVELLDLEGEIEVWGFGDEDLGIPVPRYVPARLFQDHLTQRPLDLQGDRVEVTVPDVPALLVTKLAALRNRDLAFRSFTEGRAGMLLGPSLLPLIRQKAESYYLRKAGKDLFDVGLLLGDLTDTDRLTQLLQQHGLEDIMTQVPGDLSEAVRLMAQDLAHRSDVPDPMMPVQAWLGV